jgi:hypothetical protein
LCEKEGGKGITGKNTPVERKIAAYFIREKKYEIEQTENVRGKGQRGKKKGRKGEIKRKQELKG